MVESLLTAAMVRLDIDKVLALAETEFTLEHLRLDHQALTSTNLLSLVR